MGGYSPARHPKELFTLDNFTNSTLRCCNFLFRHPGESRYDGPQSLRGCLQALLCFLFSSSFAATALCGNFSSITLQLTLVTNAPTLNIAYTPTPTVYFRDYLSVPVTVSAVSAKIQSVKLFYRPAGGSAYTEAAGLEAFSPNPSNKTSYTGRAIIPGSVLAGNNGVEYYIDAAGTGGETAHQGTAASPFLTTLSAAYAASLGEGGGTVILPDGDSTDGNTSLAFPPNSFTGTLQIQMEQLDPGVPAQSISECGVPYPQRPLEVYRFTAVPHLFSKPLTLSLLYSDVDGAPGQVDGSSVDETTLRAFWCDGFAWRPMGGNVNPSLNTVSFPTTHFSLFALFPAGAFSTPQVFRPMEKIITPNGDGTNDRAFFSGLSGVYAIEIYDVTGRRVRRIHDFPEWDGRDDNGKIVETGTYIYQYQTDNSNDWVSGTIGVAK